MVFCMIRRGAWRVKHSDGRQEAVFQELTSLWKITGREKLGLLVVLVPSVEDCAPTGVVGGMGSLTKKGSSGEGRCHGAYS